MSDATFLAVCGGSLFALAIVFIVIWVGNELTGRRTPIERNVGEQRGKDGEDG